MFHGILGALLYEKCEISLSALITSLVTDKDSGPAEFFFTEWNDDFRGIVNINISLSNIATFWNVHISNLLSHYQIYMFMIMANG